MKKVICLLSSFFLLASCNEEDEFSDVITVSTVPELAALVPTTRASCNDLNDADVTTNSSVGPSSLAWRSFRVEWKDTARDLYIISIKLTLQIGTTEVTSLISDTQEIDNMFGIVGTKIPKKGTDAAQRNGIYASDRTNKPDSGEPCSLAFGSISAPINILDTVNGTVRITGIAVDSAGNEEVIRSTADVQVVIDTK